eukprot:2592743-Rhodomonas_salina.1
MRGAKAHTYVSPPAIALKQRAVFSPPPIVRLAGFPGVNSELRSPPGQVRPVQPLERAFGVAVRQRQPDLIPLVRHVDAEEGVVQEVLLSFALHCEHAPARRRAPGLGNVDVDSLVVGLPAHRTPVPSQGHVAAQLAGPVDEALGWPIVGDEATVRARHRVCDAAGADAACVVGAGIVVDRSAGVFRRPEGPLLPRLRTHRKRVIEVVGDVIVGKRIEIIRALCFTHCPSRLTAGLVVPVTVGIHFRTVFVAARVVRLGPAPTREGVVMSVHPLESALLIPVSESNPDWACVLENLQSLQPLQLSSVMNGDYAPTEECAGSFLFLKRFRVQLHVPAHQQISTPELD